MFKTLIALVLTIASIFAHANEGVAFVHGTGSQTDAYNNYWTGSNIQSIVSGLPNSSNYTVINCDFNQYMWDSRA